MILPANASHHRQQKTERGTSGAFYCPSACDCYTAFQYGTPFPEIIRSASRS